MKKLLILLTFLLNISFIMPCYADGFVGSITKEDVYIDGPGAEYDPTTGTSSIIIPDFYDDGCDTKIVLTPYDRRSTLDQGPRELLEYAYQTVVDAGEDVASLNMTDITAKANEVGASNSSLVVRDIFDISMHHIPEFQGHPDNHESFIEIVLKTKSLEKFVCLLHYKNYTWNVVDDAYVYIDNNHLFVSVEELSPFAIVISTDDIHVEPVPEHKDEPVKPEEKPTEPVTPVEPVEPVNPVEPVEPIEPGKKGCCIWHWFILLTCLITTILAQFIRVKVDDSNDKEETNDNKKTKKNVKFRDFMSLINIVLCIIFFILGTCKFDLYALILDIILLIIIFYYTHRNKKDNNEDQ